MDENKDKASLRGRGEEIMRGSGSGGSGEQPPPNDPRAAGSWLPEPDDDNGEDIPSFEDENALLRWMEADPEAHRPTSLPNQSLLDELGADWDIEAAPSSDQPSDPFAEPDFDAIFGETDTTPAPSLNAEMPDLDTLFGGDEPDFDDLFSDEVDIQTAQTISPLDTREINILEDRLAERLNLDAMATTELTQPLDFSALNGEEYSNQAENAALESPADDDLDWLSDLDQTDEQYQRYQDEVGFQEAQDFLSLLEAEAEAADTPTDFDLDALVIESVTDQMSDRPLSDIGNFSGSSSAEPESEFDATELGRVSAVDAELEAALAALETPMKLPALEETSERFGYEAGPAPEPPVSLDARPSQPLVGLAASEQDFSAPSGLDVGAFDEAYVPTYKPVAAPTGPLDDPYHFVAHLEQEAASRALETPLHLPADSAAQGQDQPIGSAFGLSDAGDPPQGMRNSAARIDSNNQESIPLGEESTRGVMVDLGGHELHPPRYDSLNPLEPETLAPGELPPQIFHVDHELGGGTPENKPENTRTGGLLPAGIGSAETPTPFGEIRPRVAANEIFKPNELASDGDLLSLLVDDNRLRELFEQIEALHEEVVEGVRGQRGYSDVYQEELLQASNMLLRSRENYDEARAVVYRVRADLRRERRVSEDTARYRPLITNIYIGMAILIVVFALLGSLFTNIAESVGVNWLGQGYYPALAGVVGALLFGYRTLNRHTTELRDFDASHVNWYLVNPLMGFLSGFLAYLFMLATALQTIDNTSAEITGASPITLLIAVAVGYNQNLVINLLDTARQRLGGSDKDNERPPSFMSGG